MRRRYGSFLSLILALCCLMLGCGRLAGNDPRETDDITVIMDLNTVYPSTSHLPDGEGKRVKVILLLGQSNATGSSIVEYLRDGVTEEEFARYEAGFPTILVNYCLDDHNATSDGAFVKVDLTCGATNGFFGPEIGMAEVLSEAYPEETVYLLKFTMSGYSLHHHWLRQGQRGSIYEAFLAFAQTYMDELIAHHYDARIGAICWMQGESDTSEFKASRYYDNQTAFVSYLREDLAKYAEEGGIYFIDAGISDGPYCLPGYPAVNEAKARVAELSPLNLYFSTIDAGLTVDQEPHGAPDWGHYDALCERTLGRLFGEAIVETYRMRVGVDNR